MKETNKYQNGARICQELFTKTGDVRYHNMMNGFKALEKESLKSQEIENQPGM